MYSYLSPLIYPLTGSGSSALKVALDLPRICSNRVRPGYTGKIYLEWFKFVDGSIVKSEKSSFNLTNGKANQNFFMLETSNENIGYIEIHLTCNDPVFQAIDVSAGYAFYNCEVNGIVNVNADAKYARPLVIQQIRHTKSFCLSHSNCFMDKNAGIGSYFLVVNPYLKPLKAKLENALEKRLSLVVQPQSTKLINLEPLLQDKLPSTCMVVSKNRHPAWIVHTNSKPSAGISINRVDHLELFRAEKSFENLSFRKLGKRALQILAPLKF